MPRPAVSIRNVGKVWEADGRPPLRAIDSLSFDVAPGEFVVLLGPSGCGKSSLLYMIAGLESVSSGVIEDDGVPIDSPSPERGLIFQEASLFPWLTILDNVAFGLAIRAEMPERRREMATAILRRVGLGDVLDKKPDELSGGMRQRVQIARVLVNQPPVVLMDEPFGALDAQTRAVMQSELVRIWQATRPTILFITHDIAEAILLADRIVTMSAGPDARLKTIAPVPLARPRDLLDAEAAALYRRLRDDIGAEVTKTLRAQGLASEPGAEGAP
jgi:NitT/TauT family transport system ATP-binding protein